MNDMTPPQVPDAQGGAPEPASPTPPPVNLQLKPKTDVGFFVLGFIGAMVLYTVISLLAVAVSAPALVAGIGGLVLVFLACVALFLAGKRRADVRLRSVGKGGMWACLAVPLFVLLAFGTCAVLLGGQQI